MFFALATLEKPVAAEEPAARTANVNGQAGSVEAAIIARVEFNEIVL
jgi:hypothetical protein